MRITFDPIKRDTALADRGLDFADAVEVFAGPVFEAPDDRFDYGEERISGSCGAGWWLWFGRSATMRATSYR